jgi:ParB-like chromosome segregation protein Spo0J
MLANAEVRVNIVEVPICKVIPNQWNPNRQSDHVFEAEKNSIRVHGFIDPITVREVGVGLFEIIDGEHRWKAAKALGLEFIPVNNLGEVPDVIAKQLTVITNETRGQADRALLAKLLEDLTREIPREVLLASLPYKEIEFDALVKEPVIDMTKLEGPPRDKESTRRTVSFLLPVAIAALLEGQLDRLRKLVEKVDLPEGFKADDLAVLVLCRYLAEVPNECLI